MCVCVYFWIVRSGCCCSRSRGGCWMLHTCRLMPDAHVHGHFSVCRFLNVLCPFIYTPSSLNKEVVENSFQGENNETTLGSRGFALPRVVVL